jgi:hypothetical protein
MTRKWRAHFQYAAPPMTEISMIEVSQSQDS